MSGAPKHVKAKEEKWPSASLLTKSICYKHIYKDDFYVFSTRSGEEQNTVEMLIEDKPIDFIIASGANYFNLMSEGVNL